MALPTFEYDRRIDIVDALNELSTAADAAIEAGGGSSSYVLPVAADAVLGGVKGQRVEGKDGNSRIVQVTPDGTAFIGAADALNPGVVRSKEGNSFADADANIAVNAHGYMKCDVDKAYVAEQIAGVEVPVDTTAGLGYGSNGLEVAVDGSTIDFNSAGQLTALGGGFTPFTIADVAATGTGSKIGRWTLYNPAYGNGLRRTVAGFVGEDWIYLIGTTLDKSAGNITASELVNVSYDDPIRVPYVNGMLVSRSPTILTCVPVSYVSSSSTAGNTLLEATYSSNQALLMLSTHGAPTNGAPDNELNFYCELNILITVK